MFETSDDKGLRNTSHPDYNSLLEELDNAENLTEWEANFVGSLIDSVRTAYSWKENQLILKIYNERIQGLS